MIVRPLGEWIHLALQNEHARHSAVLTASLRPEFLGPPQFQRLAIEATALHDLGWLHWDADPTCDAEGLPANFDAMEKAAHHEIWRRGVFESLVSHGPEVAMLLARHASSLAAMPPVDDAAATFAEMLPVLEQRAWPDVPADVRTARREQAFAALAVGDALSLLVGAGWNHRLRMTLLREDGTTMDIEAWRDGDWTARVAPWPFAVPGALSNVWLDMVAVPRAEAAHCKAILATPRQYLVRRRIDYREG